MGLVMPRKYRFVQTSRAHATPLEHALTLEVEVLTDICSFVHTPDPSTVFCIYHATASPTDGWSNRKAHVGTLGPEALLHDQTVICGMTTAQGHREL